MKNKFQSKSVPRGTRTIWRYLSAFILLFSLSIGQMWGADPIENVGTYSTQVISADGKTSTWTFILPSSQVTVPNAETEDVDIIYVPGGSSKMKFSSSNGLSWSGNSNGYIYVPSGAAGTISMTVKSSSDNRWLQLYVAGSAAADSKRLWSKYADPATSARGPQSFAFTSADLTTKGTKTYLHFRDNNTEMKIATITVTLTTGTYGSTTPDETAPTLSSSVPANSATDVAVEGTIVLTFSEAIATVDGSKFTLDGATKGTVAIDGTDAKKVNVPYSGAANSATVTLSVAAEAVADAAGNKSAALSNIAFTTVAAVTPVCPSGISISGTKDYTAGETIELTAALEAGNGDISYQWYKGSIAVGNEVGTGATFTKANCVIGDAGDYFCVASKDDCSNATSTAYAVTVAPVSYCAELVPATSGDAPAAGDPIALTTATGGSIKALTTNISYTANGLLFGSSSSTKAEVTLNHLMQVGTVITATIYNDNNDKARGLNLLNSSGTSKATWTKTQTGDHVETYTVVAGDGLAGSNVFQLQRNNNAYLKSISVSNCGAELFALSSAVSVDGKATVTLSKNLVAEGATATATYSDIDAAYDFDEWEITSGDATIADATVNPAVITMGSGAATITLKLKAASVKYAVHFDSKGGSAVADQSIEAGEHASVPTAPTKFKYTFGGWSETDGGSTPANLAEIAINAEKTFYAIWTPKVCPTSGTIFSLSQNGSAPTSEVKWTNAENDGARDVSDYFNVVNGIAELVNHSSSNNQVSITTDPKMKFSNDANGWAHLRLECALAEGDVITLDNTNKCIVSYTADKEEGTTYTLPNSSSHKITVPASWDGQDELYIFRNGSNFYISSITIVRPEKFDVTFNLHGHGTPIAPQSVLDGGKVTKPSDPSESGWDFDGWYATYVADPESYDGAWDFDNDVVTAATELHAKWTEHVLSDDATLSSLTYQLGSAAPIAIALVADKYAYAVELPMGTTDIPVVFAVANDPNRKALSITQATLGNLSASVSVTAEDNTTTQEYTITFSVATSKAIQLVFKTGSTACVGSASTATQILSNNAAVSTYINQITFTNVEGAGDDGAEGSSLNVGKKAGNMFTLSAKAGYAFQAMNFLAKIQDATCEYSIDGGAWTELASTSTSADECYAPFTSGTVHEFRLRSTGTSGVWIRNMQLTMIEACTPITLAWAEEPVEFEVGKSGYAIAATANNAGEVAYSSADGDIIAVNASTGVLTVNALGSVALKAATAEGDGTTYCANGGDPIVLSKAVNTYYLVQFDAQNETSVDEVKYYSGDAAIAQPAEPSYAGFDFQGWFDAATGGNPIVWPLTPAASMTVYAQWVAQCDGPTITVQPASANYLTGRAAAALACTATAGAAGELTYTWYSCDDAIRTNPVELAGAPTPSTAAAATFYYYCAVTEAGCDVVRNSDVATITVVDKDGICIIKVATTGGTNKTVTGLYAEDGVVNIAGDKKFGGSGQYIGMMLQEGKTFDEGDIINVHTTTAAGQGTIAIYSNSGKTATQVYDFATMGVAGNNKFALPAAVEDMSTLYVCRTDADNWNGYVDYIEVTRACAPILNKITVAGVEGAPVGNVVEIEVPASTADAALDAIVYDWVSNDDAWTAANAPVATNAWEFGVANTVTFTDKDGDQSVYTVTISKAVPSSDATLSALSASAGTLAPAFDPAVLTYTVALPYGTSDVPTLSATKNHVGAAEPVIADAAAFVNRKAVSTVTVTAEDGTTELTYTVTFNVERFESTVIWDGSTMSAVATSPVSGFTWAVTGFKTIDNYSVSYGTKAYTKYLPSGGSASDTRYIELNVPEGKMAKFYIVFGSHSDSEESRGMFIGTSKTKNLDESSILTLYSNIRTDLKAGTSELVLGEGTWYINPMKSVDFYEISATLMPVGYQRTVTEGRMGTVCLPKNVEAGYIYGAEVYTLLYWKYGTSYADCQMVDFGEVEEMQAGYPYMIIPTSDKFAVVYGDEEYVGDGVHMANGFTGTINAIAAAPDNVLVGKYGIINNMVQKLGTNCNSPANRAYIDLSETPSKEEYEASQAPNPAPRKRVSLGNKGTQVTTSLDAINVESGKIEKVIIDGQLFILRGEKLYDATGRLVK